MMKCLRAESGFKYRPPRLRPRDERSDIVFTSPTSRACAIAISSGVGATKTGAAGAGGVAFVGGAVGAGAGAAMP